VGNCRAFHGGQSKIRPSVDARHPGELLRRQAEAVGLPLEILELPDPCSNEDYADIMRDSWADAPIKKFSASLSAIFSGRYPAVSEKQLEGTGITAIFPLWKIPTVELAERMFAAGVEAYLSSVDLKKLPSRFAGRNGRGNCFGNFPRGSILVVRTANSTRLSSEDRCFRFPCREDRADR